MIRKSSQFILPLVMILMISWSGTNGTRELMMTDRAFSDLSLEQGMKKAFFQYAADSVVLLQKNTWPIKGKLEMKELFQTYSDTGFVLTWEPLDAKMAGSEDLGYTYGICTMVDKASQEKVMGKYVTIWEKQTDGTWKFLLDGGNEGLGEKGMTEYPVHSRFLESIMMVTGPSLTSFTFI